MEQIGLGTIHEDLESLKKEVRGMRETIADCFLTSEEEKLVDKAREELENGEATSLEDLEFERKNVKS